MLFVFLHDYSILDQLHHINMTPMKAHIPGTCTCTGTGSTYTRYMYRYTRHHLKHCITTYICIVYMIDMHVYVLSLSTIYMYPISLAGTTDDSQIAVVYPPNGEYMYILRL